MLLRGCMVALGSGLLFRTMWFASPAGFFGALVAGAVVFALADFARPRRRTAADAHVDAR